MVAWFASGPVFDFVGLGTRAPGETAVLVDQGEYGKQGHGRAKGGPWGGWFGTRASRDDEQQVVFQALWVKACGLMQINA